MCWVHCFITFEIVCNTFINAFVVTKMILLLFYCSKISSSALFVEDDSHTKAHKTRRIPKIASSKYESSVTFDTDVVLIGVSVLKPKVGWPLVSIEKITVIKFLKNNINIFIMNRLSHTIIVSTSISVVTQA